MTSVASLDTPIAASAKVLANYKFVRSRLHRGPRLAAARVIVAGRTTGR